MFSVSASISFGSGDGSKLTNPFEFVPEVIPGTFSYQKSNNHTNQKEKKNNNHSKAGNSKGCHGLNYRCFWLNKSFTSHLLYIFTIGWVLCTTFAGQQMHFSCFFAFFSPISQGTKAAFGCEPAFACIMVSSPIVS